MATHELRSLVAQGEIRAFRDDDSLKFRRTDVLDLKKSRETHAGGLVIEPDELGDETLPTVEPGEIAPGPEVKSAKHETEETELLTGIGQEGSIDFLGLDDTAAGDTVGGDTAQTVVPTIEIADEDVIDDTARTVIPTFSGEADIIGEDETIIPAAAPILLEEDEATEMATQEIQSDGLGAPTKPAVGAEDETVPEERPLRFQDTGVATDELDITTDELSASATAGITAPRRSQQYQEEVAAATISPIFFVVAVVTFLVLLFAVPIFYGIATDTAPGFAVYKNLLDFLAENTIR
ncbi:MAG: hypothetical protein ABIF82_14405 [Planctomycetota bacterium]